ncbi:hypothetical protein PQX77_006500 [Marasmius sp. AFHP31]|nr:hypothetical protein PQX77_006500 [Marasmius sp. AFHP31]
MKPSRLHKSYVKSVLGLELFSSVYPGFHEPPLPSTAHESLSTSKPAGQQEASLVPTTANPSPSPLNPPTSTVPLVVVLEITSSSSSLPTNSTHRSFADLDCDPRQKAMLALQFTFVPNRNLPPIHTQEYIFVINKSRSTYRTGKTDPGYAASNLEDDVQYFNFGHDCHGIWIRSGHHTETTLDNTDDDMADKIVSPVQSLSTSHNTRLEIHALGIGSGVST